MHRILFLVALSLIAGNISAALDGLRHKLENLAGKNNIGIALITCYGDTLAINGDHLYDMASVAKFHQAIALSKTLSFDEIVKAEISIDPSKLEKNTWSPMRASAGDENFVLTPAALLDYSLMMSDNNAADILFERYNSPSAVDSILHLHGYPGRYRISFTEKQMHADSLGAVNYSTPTAAAAAINRFFASDTTATATLVKAIMSRDTPFGKERIVAGLDGKSAKVFHKTGTGFNGPNGTPEALNDLAFVSYKTEWGYGCYSLAVFLKDFSGSRPEGEKLMADISSAVWDAVIVDEVKMMNVSAKLPAKTHRNTSIEYDPSFRDSVISALFDCVLYHALGLDDY